MNVANRTLPSGVERSDKKLIAENLDARPAGAPSGVPQEQK